MVTAWLIVFGLYLLLDMRADNYGCLCGTTAWCPVHNPP
jgi:hypothetical protein